MAHTLLLLSAAFLAGILNAVAGGGSFLTFPALVFVGVPAVIANATSTVALLPGSFASAYSYRRGLGRLEEVRLGPLVIASLAGGITGAILLLATPEKVFINLTPWLLLFATATFAFGKRLDTLLKRHFRFGVTALIVAQSIVAIYGGYFGGGVGILMLAMLGIFGMTNIHAMNGIKTVMAGTLNGIAVVIFAAAGKVFWRQAFVMMIATAAGGYFGAHFAQKVRGTAIRAFVIVTGVLMMVYFFFHAYLR